MFDTQSESMATRFRALALLASLLASLALTACGGGSGEDNSSSDADSGSGDSTNPQTPAIGTAGIECDYSYSQLNESASLNLTSFSTWSCTDTARALVSNGGTCSDAADCNLGGNGGSWSIEALGQSGFDFGTDANNAHVQPTGEYHYHGLPEGFITLRGRSAATMTLIGWASDGFPIYARYGYISPSDASSGLKIMTGSYQIASTISASRPDVTSYPLGTFTQDYEYAANAGDLDECNGRTGVTPEFPEGTYHYYATATYPFLPRCVKGEIEGGRDGGPPPRGEAGTVVR